MAMNELRAKREKLLLSRMAPVEASDELPEGQRSPHTSDEEEAVATALARKRRLMRGFRSSSQCSISNLGNTGLTSWKSSASFDYGMSKSLAGVSASFSTSFPVQQREKKSVSFADVQVFYFRRNQGISVVPSQEGASLGMENKHYSSRKYSLYDFSRAKAKESDRKWTQVRRLLYEQSIPTGRQRKQPRRGNTNRVAHKAMQEALEIEKAVKEVIVDMIETVVASRPSPADESCTSSDDEEEVFGSEPEAFQPLAKDIRHAILETCNVDLNLEGECENHEIRASRIKCGCSCRNGNCVVRSCECAINGIQCQVDEKGFPCTCVKGTCKNPEGRIEFNPGRVRSHYLSTLKRYDEMEKTGFEAVAVSPRRSLSEDSDDAVNSYFAVPPPPSYKLPKEEAVEEPYAEIVWATSSSASTSASIVVNNNNGENKASTAVVAEVHDEAQVHTPTQQEKPKKVFPVTPVYKREPLLKDLVCREERAARGDLFPPIPSLFAARRCVKRPTSITSIVSIGNVDSTPVVKKKRRMIPSLKSILMNFSQTFDEENLPSEALGQPESSKYEGNGT